MNAPVWPIYAVAVVSVAAAGFFSGTWPGEEPIRRSEVETASPGRPVPAYADLGDRRRGPNGELYLSGLAPLHARVEVTPGDRESARARRAERRAYDGAPPVIPHAIDQRGLPTCLACHRGGVVIGGKLAPAMSHEEHASCVQCHVVAQDPRPFSERSPGPDNRFVGLASAGPGTRAWPGAPPTMPHTSWMRSDCTSCHGPSGLPGLRTSHPERQSCRQCHAPETAREQRFPRVTP